MKFRLIPIMVLIALNALLVVGTWTLTAQPAQTITGVLGMIVEDPNGFNGESRTIYNIIDSVGQRIDLTITPEVLGAAGGYFAVYGRTVDVTLDAVGVRDGLARVSAIHLTGDATRWFTVDPTGVEHWNNLLCKYSNVSSTPVTRDYIVQMMAQTSPMLGHYWAAMGRGESSISHTTTQWKTMPSGITSSSSIYDMFDACMIVHGFDPDSAGNFNTFYNQDMSAAWGGYTGWGGNVQRRTWLPAWSYRSGYTTISHEMGHAYGLPHGNNSDGDSSPYDNPWDTMSSSYGMTFVVGNYRIAKPTNNYYAHQIGFIPDTAVYTFTGYGTQEVIIDHVGLQSTPNYFNVYIDLGGGLLYSLETRMQSKGGYQSGFIDYFTGQSLNGVLVYSINPSRSEPAWQALAKTDEQGYSASGILSVGQTFKDNPRAITVKVLEVTPNGYRVQISRTQPIVMNTPIQNETVQTAFPTFTWDEIAGATSYQVTVVSKTTGVTFNFKQPLGTEACDAGVCSFTPTTLPWKVKNAATYQWSVTASNDAGLLAKSVKRAFIVGGLPTTILQTAPDVDAIASGAVHFTWEDDSRVATWMLVLKNKAGLVKFKQNYPDSDICNGATCDALVDLTLFKKGFYTWRVVAKHPNVIGKRNSPWRPVKIQVPVRESDEVFRTP